MAEKEMNMVEILSEELGEKELKIMELEKEVEELEKRLKEEQEEKIKYYETTHFNGFKIDFLYSFGGVDDWCVNEVIDQIFIERYPSVIFNYDDEVKYKLLMYHFDGSIMTKEEIIENLDDFGDDFHIDVVWEEFVHDHYDGVIDLENGKYWVSDDVM